MGKLKDDNIKWTLDVNASPAQKSFQMLGSEIKSLESENKKLKTQMEALELQGKKGSEEWKKLSLSIKENSVKISESKKKQEELMSSMDSSEKTMSQLRKEAKSLSRELSNMTRGTDEYRNKASRLQSVQNELRKAQTEMNGSVSTGSSVMTTLSAKSAILGGALFALASKTASAITEQLSLNRIIQSNQTTGDNFNNMMAGMNSAFDTLRVNIAQANFKTFYRDLVDSYIAGKNLSAVLDEMFERNNSFRIETAKNSAELVSLNEDLRNVNLTLEERHQAGLKIKQITAEQMSVQKSMYEDEAKAQKEALQARTRMSDDELEFMVDKYNQNRSLINQASEYIKLEKDLTEERERQIGFAVRGLTVDYSNEERILAEIAAYKQLRPEIIETSAILKKYNRSNDEVVAKYVETKVKAINIESESNQSLIRTTTLINSIEKQQANESLNLSKAKIAQIQKENEEKAKQAEIEKKNSEVLLKEKESLFGKLDALQQSFDRSQMTVEERKLYEIADKYNALQKELDTALSRKLISEEEYHKKSLELQVLHGQEELSYVEEMSMAAIEKKNKIQQDENNKMQSDADNVRNQLLSSNLENQYNIEMEAIKTLHEAKMLSDEEYAKASMQIQLGYITKKIAKEKQLLNVAASVANSLQDLALSKAERRYEEEMSLAGNNAEKQAEIKEKYEQDKLDIEKKYADVNFAIKVSSIIADTAVAIMQSYAQLGPIAGSVAAALMSTTGAIQIAVANQERQKIKSMTLNGAGGSSQQGQISYETTGFSSGGWTGPGDTYDPAGIVHADEYVIPKRMMHLPEVIPVLSYLENIRTDNKDNGAGNGNGYAGGGYTSEDDIFRQIYKLLEDISKNPVPAYILLSEFEKQQLRRDKAKMYGSK